MSHSYSHFSWNAPQKSVVIVLFAPRQGPDSLVMQLGLCKSLCEFALFRMSIAVYIPYTPQVCML